MSEKEALQGLNCPRCGGMVPIPEGQVIVICPYCELRAVVRGEKGVRRYQTPCRINREQAIAAFRHFLSGNWAIARDAARQAQLEEAMLVHLPFWAAWGQGLGWTFGRKKIGSGDRKRYEPREVRVVEEMSWNGAACDVGEFGVSHISLDGRPLEPFDPDQLHRTGLVFEPVGSSWQALETARQAFENRVNSRAHLDEISQSFVRIVRPRLGLLYYPLWVVRYLYHGRSFQVVVDGFDGSILYGKAPGNVLYRAAVLVGGMALGSAIAIDLTALILTSSNDSDGSFGAALASFVGGLVILFLSYRKFRYGEHYEYHRYRGEGEGIFSGLPLQGTLRQAIKVIDTLERSS